MDAEQIKQWLLLQSKEESHLRVICQTLKLPDTGDKDDLVNVIINGTVDGSIKHYPPQLIPLRTRDQASNLIQEAVNCFKNWRRMIFQTQGNRKEFSILNNKGQQYCLEMKYLKCKPKTALEIIKRRWYLPYSAQKALIQAIEKEPEAFVYHIVQKPGKNNTSYVMLHVERMAA